jgi:hypothetical protein
VLAGISAAHGLYGRTDFVDAAEMTFQRQGFVLTFAIGVAVAGFAGPASGQFRDFFQFPFASSPPPAAPTEATRPPPPRKVDTPPSQTVVVIGDSLADWLGFGLEEAFTDTPDIGIVRKIRPLSGLIRYEPRSDAPPDWSQVVKEMLASEKPAAIVVMLGINDRIPMRERVEQHPPAGTPGTPPGTKPAPAADTAQPASEQPSIAAPEQHRVSGGSYEFHTEQWEDLYTKRIDDMIAAVKSKGVPVFWVGLPALRGTRSISDVSYLDELYRARAEKAGIIYVDIWDGFVDDQGRYAVQGPDFEGQIRRLRTYDGVNFTKAGAEKLAHYVEHELRRVVTSHIVPEAVPVPEEQNISKAPVGERPAVGQVIPLTATGGGSGGDLLGGSRQTPGATDPVAVRVLSRGEALAAPAGRADDFSWPRSDTRAAPAPSEPGPTASAPRGTAGKTGATGTEPAKPEPNKAEPNKDDSARPDGKKPAAVRAPPPPTAGTAPPVRRPRPELDGAVPRPPAPIGPAAASIH